MHPSGTAMAAKTGSRFCLSATQVIIFAHFLTIAVTTLILVWLLNSRRGVAFEFRTQEKIFSLHSFLMDVGFVLATGEGINTSHSWIGMSTFCLFGLQFLLCFFSFMFPSANSGVRSRMAPLHMFVGIFSFLMAIASAETGLVERFTILGLPHHQPTLIMNSTGLLILLSGVGVALGTRSRMVQVFIGIVISLLAMTSAEVKFTPLYLQRQQEAVIMNFTGILIILFGVAVWLVLILRRPY